MSRYARVLVTGSRSWKRDTLTTDGRTLDNILDEAAVDAAHKGYAGLLLVHGGARGADLIADGWYRNRAHRGWPVDVERHPVSGADWATRGNRAGYERNAAMVEAGADICLAFVAQCQSPRCHRPQPHGSHGAIQCAELAEGAEIHVQRFEAADLAVQRVEARPLLHLPDSKE